MWLNTEEYGGDSILLQQLVVALSLKAVRGEVLRTDTAVLRGLEVLPSDGCLPLFAETRPGQREPEKTQRAVLTLIMGIAPLSCTSPAVTALGRI